MMSNHLHDAIFGDRARDDAACLVTRGKEPRRLSFSDMDKMAARMARALWRLGARPGSAVMAQVEKSPETLGLFLACLRGGYVFRPLGMEMEAEAVAGLIGGTSPAVVICDPGGKEALAGAAKGAGARLVSLRGEWRGSFFMLQMVQPERFDAVERAADDAAAILHDGETLSHGGLLTAARELADERRMGDGGEVSHELPLHGREGLVMAVAALLAGAEMTWPEK